jgi:hypothetical protein
LIWKEILESRKRGAMEATLNIHPLLTAVLGATIEL